MVDFMSFPPTDAQVARATTEWSRLAGEAVRVDVLSLGSPVYAFGSELACLRLFHKMPNGYAGFSKSEGWYFRTAYPHDQHHAA